MRILLLLVFSFHLYQLQAQVFAPQLINARQLNYWDSQSWDYTLIDLRQPVEYSRGHIPGAVNIPWPTLTRQIVHELRTEVVVLYSHNQKLTDLISHKFSYRVFALSGGLSDWSQASYPLVGQEQSPFANSEQKSTVFMAGAANSTYMPSSAQCGEQRPGPDTSSPEKPFKGRRNYRNKFRLKPRRWTRGRLRRRGGLLPTR